MKLKLFSLIAWLVLGFTSLAAQAAFVSVTPVASVPTGYDLVNLINGPPNGTLHNVHLEGALPAEVLYDSSYQGGGNNQSVTTIGNLIANEFGLTSWTSVAQGGGSTITSDDPFNYLAVHIGKGELLFHFLTAINSFTVTTTGRGNGVGDWRAYNGSQVPVPAAVWLFGSALVGLFGVKRKNS